MKFILFGLAYATIAFVVAKLIAYRVDKLPIPKEDSLDENYNNEGNYVNHDGVYSFSDN